MKQNQPASKPASQPASKQAWHSVVQIKDLTPTVLSLLGKNFPKTLVRIFSESPSEQMWYFKIKITATPSEIFHERSFIFSSLSASVHPSFFVQSFTGVLGDSPNKLWYRWNFLICEEIMKGNTYTLACWVCFISFSTDTKTVPIKENPECFYTLDFFIILLLYSEIFSKIPPVNKLEHKILSNHVRFW